MLWKGVMKLRDAVKRRDAVWRGEKSWFCGPWYVLRKWSCIETTSSCWHCSRSIIPACVWSSLMFHCWQSRFPSLWSSIRGDSVCRFCGSILLLTSLATKKRQQCLDRLGIFLPRGQVCRPWPAPRHYCWDFSSCSIVWSLALHQDKVLHSLCCLSLFHRESDWQSWFPPPLNRDRFFMVCPR